LSIPDPLIGEATVAVLRYHGFHVHVPRRQKGSGIPAFAAGDAETARETAAHNIRILADLIRDGYTVICSDPTAALALTQDYLDLSDDPDTRLVAGHTVELTAFLWQLHESGRLHSGFRQLDLDLGHHVPCHLKALRSGTPAGPRLLELIPGVRVHTIDKSCSGMAGAWGLKSGNYEISLAAGQPMIEAMNRPQVLFGSTECGSCRLQMQQGSGKRTLHPVQYLALAYGLLPELEARLLRPLGTRITD
jgi:Fe-S oxidoreductase